MLEFWIEGRGAKHDLSSSSVPSVEPADLGVDPASVPLGYGEPLGSRDLREVIADLHGVDADQVIVTTGAHEANNIAFIALLRRGTALVETPHFEPLRNVPEGLGARVVTARRDDLIDALAERRPDMVVVADPHNPTGHVMDVRQLLEAAHDAGTVALIDEIYRPFLADAPSAIEVAGGPTVITSSLSKIAGLGGIRIGWAVATPDIADELVRVKMNLNPTNGRLGEAVALLCLEDFDRIRERGRHHVREGTRELRRHLTALDLPESNLPFAYCRYANGPPSLAIARQLLERESVCVLPAEMFGDERAFRISTGMPDVEGYRILDRVLRDIGVSG